MKSPKYNRLTHSITDELSTLSGTARGIGLVEHECRTSRARNML
ncbi:hypothetical protein [Thiocystis violascens]|nr:hypothetical protein [Thiocystis violascens]